MTAAEKKIILDKGSDYRLQLKIKDDDGINDRDLTGWGFKFIIYSLDGTEYTSIDKLLSGAFSGDDLVNGACTIDIDSTLTSTYSTAIAGTEDVFSTLYNYYYTLTLYEDGANLDNAIDTREMRVARGKLAVRL